MMQKNTTKNKSIGPNLKILGLKSPMEVIDVLSILTVGGEPVVKSDQAFLDPKIKAKEVMEYFYNKFDITPNELPYLASLVKKEMKRGLRSK